MVHMHSKNTQTAITRRRPGRKGAGAGGEGKRRGKEKERGERREASEEGGRTAKVAG
jgi:hypothetical protein